MKNKILILYTSIGMGHKYIADNMAWHLSQAGYEVLKEDILKVETGEAGKFGVWLHSIINTKFPFVWHWMYFSELVNFIGRPLRVPLAKKNSEHLNSLIQKFEPEIIITTQTTATAVVASLKKEKKFNGKLVTGFSDYHLHKFWLYNEVDVYLANIEEQKQEMISLGIPENKIYVCGVTLQPFVKENLDRVKSEFGLPSNKEIVILASGSLGIGIDKNFILNFAKLFNQKHQDKCLVVACGKNKNLYNSLLSNKSDLFIPLSFYENLKPVYQVASLIITKPGGLTLAECFQAGTKILISHTLPGQEIANYNYLIKHHLVNSMPKVLTPETLLERAGNILNNLDEQYETDKINEITQKNKEGEVLLNAIKSMLNKV